MLGEIILIDDLKPSEILAESAPYESRKSQTWKQLNEFNFESLWEILTGKSEAIASGKLKVFSKDDGEVWLVVFSNGYRDLLAEASEADVEAISSQWATTEEFKWGWSQSDVQKLYKDLCSLGKDAKLKEHSLVYWGKL